MRARMQRKFAYPTVMVAMTLLIVFSGLGVGIVSAQTTSAESEVCPGIEKAQEAIREAALIDGGTVFDDEVYASLGEALNKAAELEEAGEWRAAMAIEKSVIHRLRAMALKASGMNVNVLGVNKDAIEQIRAKLISTGRADDLI